MLKKIMAGFIIVVGGLAVLHMHSSVTEDAQKQGAQALVAHNARPEDLQHLKRPAVREACTKHSDWDMVTCKAVDEKEVMIGMTVEQVRLSVGKPNSVNTTISAGRQHEQWVYGWDYVYLENGVVSSMQSSRR